MHRRVDPSEHPTPAPGRRGRHRATRTPLAAGLAVIALLAVFGAGTALLPQRVTGLGAADSEFAGIGAGGVGSTAPASPAPGLVANAGLGDSSVAPSGTAATPSAARPRGPAATRPPRVPPRDATSKKPTTAGRAPSATGRRTAAPGGRRQAPAPAENIDELELRVLELTNEQRRLNGCDNLSMNPKLRTAMRLHVQEVARHDGLYLSHVSDDGRTFVQRAKDQGYAAPGAENIARGQSSAEEVVEGWMNSAGHRANIVNCDLRAIGVSAAEGDGTLVWGQLFGHT